MIRLNVFDCPDGEESLGVCKSFAIDFNNNSIQVNAAKSLPCLAIKKPHAYSSSQSIKETVCSPQWANLEAEPVDSYIWKMEDPYLFGEVSLCFVWSLLGHLWVCRGWRHCVLFAFGILWLPCCGTESLLKIHPPLPHFSSLSKSQAFNEDLLIYTVASLSL